VGTTSLAKFLLLAFEIDVPESSLRSALKRAASSNRVIHLGGIQFQITPSGMQEVEGFIGPLDGEPAINGEDDGQR
jgi:hypothetical protein